MYPAIATERVLRLPRACTSVGAGHVSPQRNPIGAQPRHCVQLGCRRHGERAYVAVLRELDRRNGKAETARDRQGMSQICAGQVNGTKSVRRDDMPWMTYEEASRRYAPSSVDLLFVAEAPPIVLGRYFYFPEVDEHDHLWVALMKALYRQEFGETRQERLRKHDWLTRFQRDGCKLIDALKKPMPEGTNSRKSVALIRAQTDALVREIEDMGPRQVLLIKATVYDALYEPLRTARMPVVEGRLPFPGSGRQTQFHDGFRNLVDAGKLVLPSARGQSADRFPQGRVTDEYRHLGIGLVHGETDLGRSGRRGEGVEN